MGIVTQNGFVKLKARISRSGIQRYRASELRNMGLPVAQSVPNDAVMHVYRDPAEVFDAEAVDSFARLPVTVGHPPSFLSPKNTKQYFCGVTDSVPTSADNHVQVGITLMTSDAIDAYNGGARQLSAGYRSAYIMKPGRTPQGEPFDCKQTRLRGNHVAIVPAGRAGTAMILDSVEEENKMPDPVKETVDAVEFGKVKQQLDDAQKTLGTMTAERDTLKGQVDALNAAKMTDAQMDAKVEERLGVIERARKFAPSLDAKGKTLDEIKKIAILAVSPDADVKDASSEYVGGRFDALVLPTGEKKETKDEKPKPAAVVTPDFIRSIGRV